MTSQSTIKFADRISNLPPYLFAELDKLRDAKRAKGVDVISLGIGDPDLPTPEPIIEALERAARDPVNHRYPEYYGLDELREAIAAWYARRFEVSLDPATEIVPLIGSKEGIAHLPLALVNPGDTVLMTDPGYPVYAIGAMLAGGVSHSLPLTAERGWVPDLDRRSCRRAGQCPSALALLSRQPHGGRRSVRVPRGGGRVRPCQQRGPGAGRGLLGGCVRRLPLPQHPRDPRSPRRRR